MQALCLLRESLAYRRDAYIEGLRASGYQTVSALPSPKPDDVLVIWNRYGANAFEANRFERAGARVIVCENGHLGKGWRGKIWYSMALGHHAGAGSWPYGGPMRWDRWEVQLAPWRYGGKEHVVFAQRGIGEDRYRSPQNWAENVVEQLSKKRPELRLRIRTHPGTAKPPITLEEDLERAIAVVTWHSAAAAQSLLYGIPVFYACPTWIGKRSGKPLEALLNSEAPLRDDLARVAMFRNLAWAMWELEEVARGDPFKHLLYQSHARIADA